MVHDGLVMAVGYVVSLPVVRQKIGAEEPSVTQLFTHGDGKTRRGLRTAPEDISSDPTRPQV